MKTLHKIFNKDLIQMYLGQIIITVLTLILAIYIFKSGSENPIVRMVGMFSIFVTIVLPLFIFISSFSFTTNIQWLINQHFSRKTLMNFFCFSQSLKVFLSLGNYIILCTILYLFGMTGNQSGTINKTNNGSFLDFENLYADYFTLFIVMLSIVYVIYVASLFSANKLQVERLKYLKPTQKKKRDNMIVFCGVFLMFVTSVTFSVPDVVKGYLWCLFLSYTSIIVYHRAFRLHKPIRFRMYSFMGSVAICAPLVALVFLMRGEVKDQTLSFKSKSHSVQYLSWLNPRFSDEELIGFLSDTDNSMFEELLDMYGKKIPFSKLISTVNTKTKVEFLLTDYLKKTPEQDTKLVIDHMSSFQKEKKLGFKLALFSTKYFSKQKVSEAYINELIQSKDSYKQLAALYFASNSFNKEEFENFYSKSISNLDPVITENKELLRNIAGEISK